jgi:hypothetical protein
MTALVGPLAEWHVTNLHYVIQTGIVYCVEYSLTATLGEQVLVYRSEVPLTSEGSTSPGFIPLENLTEAAVLKWVFQKLATQVFIMEHDLKAKVTALYPVTTARGLPWVE